MTATAGSLAWLERGLPRRVLAWVAVVATLTVAIVGARAGSNSALAIVMATHPSRRWGPNASLTVWAARPTGLACWPMGRTGSRSR